MKMQIHILLSQMDNDSDHVCDWKTFEAMKPGRQRRYMRKWMKNINMSPCNSTCVNAEMKGVEHAEVMSAMMSQAATKSRSFEDASAEVRTINTLATSMHAPARLMALWTDAHAIPEARAMITDTRAAFDRRLRHQRDQFIWRLRRNTDPSCVMAPTAPMTEDDTYNMFGLGGVPTIPYTGYTIVADAGHGRSLDGSGVRISGEDALMEQDAGVYVGAPDSESIMGTPLMWLDQDAITLRPWKACTRDDGFLVSSIVTAMDTVCHLMTHGVDVGPSIGVQCLGVREYDGCVVFQHAVARGSSVSNDYGRRSVTPYTQLAAMIIDMCIQTYEVSGKDIWKKLGTWRDSDDVFSAATNISSQLPANLCVAVGVLTHPRARSIVDLRLLTRALTRTGRCADWWNKDMGSMWPESMRGRAALQQAMQSRDQYVPLSLPHTQLSAHSVWGPALASKSIVFTEAIAGDAGWVWPCGDAVAMKQLGDAYATTCCVDEIASQPLCPLVHVGPRASFASSEVGCAFLVVSTGLMTRCIESMETMHCVSAAFDALCKHGPTAMGAPISLEEMSVGAWAFFSAASKHILSRFCSGGSV